MGTTKKTDIKSLILEFVHVHDQHRAIVFELQKSQAKLQEAERNRNEAQGILEKCIVELLKKEKGHWGTVFKFFRLPDGRMCEVRDNSIFIMEMTDLS